MHDTELWLAANEQGELLETPVTRSQAAAGALHTAAHVWMWRDEEDGPEILIQLRAKDKRTWPGFYDISAAGHVDFGETPLQAAIRETREELGFDLLPEKLRLLFVYRSNMQFEGKETVIENELQWVYGYTIPHDQAFHFSDAEVESTMWLKLAEFKQLVAGELSEKQLVPHGADYFNSLLEQINRIGSLK